MLVVGSALVGQTRFDAGQTTAGAPYVVSRAGRICSALPSGHGQQRCAPIVCPCVTMSLGHRDAKLRQPIVRLFFDGERPKQRFERGTDSVPCLDDSMRPIAENS